MTFLLDVSVVIALIDPEHVHHDVAHDWFGRVGATAWATCPIVENGVIRILGHSSYPLESVSGSPARIATILSDLRNVPGHVFWPDDVSLLDSDLIDLNALLSSRHVTDSYLLALAVKHGGQLATLDRRLATGAVKSGAQALHVIARD
ncbi:PIN domain-containing protein [Bosea caraganae]|uniref:Ribonuclease VapC n=1 Tax=Bosea caraganae TaxID=2763117 RepID=A0A370L8Y0_9HYPH|nr:TA system VapC family ribonuclease toxin [Bosea caraganae]RDJ25122.1 PIN domain-containing protein [Bosea caraganae]RDJ26232.1 PIN domain-containing protein [Bosea caraganae]